jgi:hypothetical protein
MCQLDVGLYKKRSSVCHLVSFEAFSSTLKMEAICSSEMLVDFQRLTLRYIREERNIRGKIYFIFSTLLLNILRTGYKVMLFPSMYVTYSTAWFVIILLCWTLYFIFYFNTFTSLPSLLLLFFSSSGWFCFLVQKLVGSQRAFVVLRNAACVQSLWLLSWKEGTTQPGPNRPWFFSFLTGASVDGGEVKEDEMGRACRTNGGEEECI